MVQQFTVQDMTCGGCAASVRKAVQQVPGVKAVDIDVLTRNVRIEVAENVTAEQITTAITEAGYTEITAQPAA